AGISTPEQFRGRRIATPQLGNTQDVACRSWLIERGFKVLMTGGDVQVVPTENPDQLALFQQGKLDAAWTVEPWVSRLETEGDGRVFLDQADAMTTIFVGRAAVVAAEPALVAKLRNAHRELTAWILQHPDEAKALVRSELEALTRRPVAAALIDRCWPRLHFTDAVDLAGFQSFVDKARAAGLANESPDLSRLLAPAGAGR
ncbi:MAG: ABC transporter substrate-binding protein, partial [Planctomycetes bacterium]|nr:ABC transporter substrate-binding protein [Planctomycetota bacterium]